MGLHQIKGHSHSISSAILLTGVFILHFLGSSGPLVFQSLPLVTLSKPVSLTVAQMSLILCMHASMQVLPSRFSAALFFGGTLMDAALPDLSRVAVACRQFLKQVHGLLERVDGKGQ
jgi:hypothetical protein